MRRLTGFLIATALTFTMAASIEAQLTGTVIVLNKSASTASFIDVAEGRIVATSSTGAGPHELVVSS